MGDAAFSITEVLQDSAYSDEAIEKILPVVYKELRRVAAVVLRRERRRHSLVATELVHEVYLRLVGSEQPSYRDRRHFFATAAIAMRRIMVEHARKRQAGKRIPPRAIVALEDSPEPSSGSQREQQEHALDVLALHHALEKLAEIDQRMAQVVELRYFAGLTETEVALVLEVSRPTVTRDWRAARLWLRREMRG